MYGLETNWSAPRANPSIRLSSATRAVTRTTGIMAVDLAVFNASQTWNPLMSGSIRSRNTTSGAPRPTVASASPPVNADSVR